MKKALLPAWELCFQGSRALNHKPVLAKEREARLKEKGCRPMVPRLCWILVWSSAAPAALPRPRFRVRKQLEKHTHKLQRKHAKHTKLGLEPPPCGPVSQKSTRESPKTAQTSQRHPKGRHENAKETPEDPKGCQKTSGSLPKSTKN